MPIKYVLPFQCILHPRPSALIVRTRSHPRVNLALSRTFTRPPSHTNPNPIPTHNPVDPTPAPAPLQSNLDIDYSVSFLVPDWTLDMTSSPPCLLHPTFTEETPFPPLPQINDEEIRTKVLTHRSFYARPTHVFEDHPDDPSPDNEKFEHLGDSVLGLIVTGLLNDIYPNLRVGPSTKIRALIVGNATLADISRRYELPAQLRLHPAQAITLRASINIQADVFESYVGGLYLDQGLAVVASWLKALFKPYTTEAYIRVRTEHGLPPLPAPVSPPIVATASVSSTSSSESSSPSDAASSAPSSVGSGNSGASSTSAHGLPHASGTPTTTGHLALFNQQLQKARREVEWVYDDCVTEGTATTPIWIVRVEVDGEIFGRGRGGTKKAARNEAAKEGLVKLGIFV